MLSLPLILDVIFDLDGDKSVMRQAFESIVDDYVFIHLEMVRSRLHNVGGGMGSPQTPESACELVSVSLGVPT